MRMINATILIFLSGGVAFATVGGGDLTMKNEGGDVVFSHDSHVKSASLTCKGCHAEIYTNARQHVTITMQEMEQGKSCGTCHNGTKAFSVKENCESCHTQDKAKQGRKQ